MCNDAACHTHDSSTDEVQQIYESCGFESHPGRSFFLKKGVVMGVCLPLPSALPINLVCVAILNVEVGIVVYPGLLLHIE